MISSPEDAIYVNLATRTEMDIDEEFDIALIKEVKYQPEDNVFYVLSNKKNDKLGVYLVEVDASDPEENKFLVYWVNKLDIGDTHLFLVLDDDLNYKELLITYKSIYINTFNVMLIDLSSEG
jgi:hypothetical protein